MAKLEDLAERVERLVLRHQELRRTSRLIEQQLQTVSAERDSLRSRLGAARARIDALLERLPPEGHAGVEAATPRVEARAEATVKRSAP
jgi:chromosome segregation ATPase